jgi:hypothetical protein
MNKDYAHIKTARLPHCEDSNGSQVYSKARVFFTGAAGQMQPLVFEKDPVVVFVLGGPGCGKVRLPFSHEYPPLWLI